VDTILVGIYLSPLLHPMTLVSAHSFLQFFLLRRPIYPSHSGDPSPLVFIQHPMVGHDQRSSQVEFLQGDPEDREKVLVPDVDVYCYYCWDDYSFDFACTILVAGGWVCLGCDFTLVVSGTLKSCSRVLYVFFFFLLG
jgi:hypothetical protein